MWCGRGATATPTQTETDVGGTTTPTLTETDTGQTTTPTLTETDAGSTATETEVSTPTETEVPTLTETETTTPTDTQSAGFDLEAHSNAVQNADSYTIHLNAKKVTTADGTTTVDSSINATQKRIVESGEGYNIFKTQDGTLEYYQPPGETTAYLNVNGRSMERPTSEMYLIDYATLSTGSQTTSMVVTEYKEGNIGSGSTELGPATKYVISSVDELPLSQEEPYDEVKSVRYRLWVDEDTGIVAKYDYHLEVVDDGDDITLEGSFEVTDFNSTTIEKPDWAP